MILHFVDWKWKFIVLLLSNLSFILTHFHLHLVFGKRDEIYISRHEAFDRHLFSLLVFFLGEGRGGEKGRKKYNNNSNSSNFTSDMLFFSLLPLFISSESENANSIMECMGKRKRNLIRLYRSIHALKLINFESNCFFSIMNIDGKMSLSL